ncbi:YqaA family protein [Commensalibacter oyaizuii]|uniref:YqaA family protein n=1 Tax=Commensalibacter oyaizuii TaxID=3043873 RepID=A0ABT6Q311_9PROT|nr:YqaA family protein [Commensalibacter sp. TBRC 16381]MDI2090956.1 YqaA family protein [Commensalibacter sp. TBRC 16381]
MLRRLYDRALQLAASRYATLWLAIIAFSEASFFPIPPDALLCPMILAKRAKAWFYATVCTISSVLGGLLGWIIGAFLLQYIAMPIVHFYHAEGQLLALQQKFNEYGVWIILIKGLTPIPFKFVTIASGAAHFSLIPFMTASLITRGVRFFIEAALLYKFGPPIQDFIEKRMIWVATAFCLLIIGGIFALKYI